VSIGEERAKDIEERPEQCFDWEQFRAMHAEARFRSIFTTGAVIGGGSVFGAHHFGMSGGRVFLRRQPWLSALAIVGTFTVSYQFWERQ